MDLGQALLVAVHQVFGEILELLGHDLQGLGVVARQLQRIKIYSLRYGLIYNIDTIWRTLIFCQSFLGVCARSIVLMYR